MNSSKRKRHCLYFWIDVFFLSFPLFLLVGSLVGFCFLYSHNTASEFSFSNFLIDIISAQEMWFTDLFTLVFGTDNLIGDGSLYYIIYNLLYDIFGIFGFGPGDNVYDFLFFIISYFDYIIIYEFLSFFIQIVLWIPRYFKNKLYDRGLME